MRGWHSLSWVKACAATQAKYKIRATMSLTDIRPGGPATIFGSLLFGSIRTGALFFYWLNVTACLTPGNKKPAVMRGQGAAVGHKVVNIACLDG
ncbi:hypothetical protein ES703_123963 [subsurface metagenome]